MYTSMKISVKSSGMFVPREGSLPRFLCSLTSYLIPEYFTPEIILAKFKKIIIYYY